MKSALSLTVIICVAGAPLSAVERFDVIDTPIARAVTRQAARIAPPQPNELANRWFRLQALKPGTEIVVTVKGSGPVRWPFARADESTLWIKSFDRNRSLMPIARADVVEITQAATPGHPGRGALIGLAAGSLIPIFYAANYHCGGDCQIGVGAFVVFGGLGAGLGALIGEATHQPDQTIYRAP